MRHRSSIIAEGCYAVRRICRSFEHAPDADQCFAPFPPSPRYGLRFQHAVVLRRVPGFHYSFKLIWKKSNLKRLWSRVTHSRESVRGSFRGETKADCTKLFLRCSPVHGAYHYPRNVNVPGPCTARHHITTRETILASSGHAICTKIVIRLQVYS